MQIADISITDGKTTAVTHVFKPVQSGLESKYKRIGVAGQSAAAAETIVAVAKLASTANGVNKIELDLSIPVSEVVTGSSGQGYTPAPAIAHIPRAKVTFFVHQRSTVDERKDLRVMLSNLLKDGQIVDLVDNLVPAN